MLERGEPILKVLCGLLAAVLVFEVARMVVRHNPVGHLSVPQPPTLPAKTNAAAASKSTNDVTAKADSKKGTNSAAEKTTAKAETNSAATMATTKNEKDTNAVPAAATEKKGTNELIVVANEPSKKGSNAPANGNAEKSGTNKLSNADFGMMKTNAAGAADLPKMTNAALAQGSAKGGTNSAPEKPAKGRRSFPFMPGQMGGEKLPDLPPLIQARIDKVIESEIFAQLTKPQPAGLIGIAGSGAMLRSSSGQTGYVKEGDELGGLKLLKVGINRVLVLEDGKTNELTIFSGVGGETLLPKQGDTNNETITKAKTTIQ